MKTRTKENQKRLHSLILLTAFTAVLLIVSTYAWFTAQTDVSISNIRGKVEVSEGLEISLDGKRWTGMLDFGSDEVSLTTPASDDNGIIFGPVSSGVNVVPAEIKPVSTSGEAQEEAKALAMLTSNYAEGALEKVALCEENAPQGFYAFDLYVKNSSSTGTADEVLQLNSDSWAWVLPKGAPITTDTKTYNGDADSGLQNTIRVAFARYDDNGALSSIPATASGESVINGVADNYTGTKDHKINAVSIWEPNYKYHVQYILDTVKPMFDVAMETKDHGYLKSLNSADDKFYTKTLNKSSIGKKVDVYDWRETNAYLTETNTLQTERESDTSPYLNGVYDLTLTKNVTKGENTTYNKMDIAANAITKFRVYVYIEGQDPDCHNYASSGGGIEVNIGLTKDITDSADVSKREEVKNDPVAPGSFTDETVKVQTPSGI